MESASLYAERLGWAVVPIHSLRSDGACSCAKGPACGKSAAKHPRLNDWVAQATEDLQRVAEWQAAWPTGNIGIATGEVSGFFALDVDPDKGGFESLARLEAEHGKLPRTVQQRTGSGGAHYLFLMPEGVELTNTAGRLGPGLDTRGNGGQIVVAPSRSAKGQYAWVNSPWDTDVAEAPAWLLSLLRRPSARSTSAAQGATARGYFPPASPAVLQSAREALEEHGPAPARENGEGGGQHTIQAAAILTHDFALSEEEAWPLLCEWNESNPTPWDTEISGPEGLRERLRRGAKYGKAEYGCRRSMDAVAAARKRIEDWRAAGPHTDEGMQQLVESIRPLAAISGDPTKHAIIQKELAGATGLGVKALGLPRPVKPAVPRVVSTEAASLTAYGLMLGPGGAAHSNMDNAVRVLEHEKKPIYFEEFSQRIMFDGREWSDADDLELMRHMQASLGLAKMTQQTVRQAVEHYAQARSRDVVKEAFVGLVWDCTPRLDGFLSRVYGTPDSAYTRAVSANFWKGLVARATRPGCKLDTMVVLEGAQGIRKSTSLQEIVTAHFFAEASESPSTKDFFMLLQGKLLVEVGEMDSFSRADVAAVKRVLSCATDRYRAPYARTSKDYPRRGVFAGTTNRSDWARDETGARRFWPVACVRADVEYIRANRLQLFAEALARVEAGESWHEVPETEARQEQEKRRPGDPWETHIAQFLAETVPQAATVRVPDVLSGALGLERHRQDKHAEMRAAAILACLGWHKRDVWADGRKQRVWERPAV
ncbi:VapE domain-containing protein [Stigmatella erecta]|uniref:Bifunctional DNA primase/polymerase, N-terminal n=1 Tax=Stigmatella erecta TaxID=83460 RepID=A0A1I0JA19_9BACT|nr:VapE domain-containing protein [Stigmatella erecta]SEU06847.1 Bifunctional DNA primase/polymerase, N-terminal [Stigmatella erecta]